jgi:hypothetical protein
VGEEEEEAPAFAYSTKYKKNGNRQKKPETYKVE